MPKNQWDAWQKWVQAEMDRRDWNAGDLHRALIQEGVDISVAYIYQVTRGIMRSKVGYEIALAIGTIFGDETTAVLAAGYRLPEDVADRMVVRDTRGRRFILNPETQQMPETTADFLASMGILLPSGAW